MIRIASIQLLLKTKVVHSLDFCIFLQHDQKRLWFIKLWDSINILGYFMELTLYNVPNLTCACMPKDWYISLNNEIGSINKQYLLIRETWMCLNEICVLCRPHFIKDLLL
jgi:hypothetical protein